MSNIEILEISFIEYQCSTISLSIKKSFFIHGYIFPKIRIPQNVVPFNEFNAESCLDISEFAKLCQNIKGEQVFLVRLFVVYLYSFPALTLEKTLALASDAFVFATVI